MNTLGVIPARSGSKGIRDKNIRELSGKPLIAYTIEAALQCRYIDNVMVSTDSDIYAAISRKYGAEVPFLRSAKNATDMTASIDVLLEVLDEYEKDGQSFESVVLLQPTSPLRTRTNLDEAFRLFYDQKADSVVSVCECEHSPLWSNTLPDDLNMFKFIKNYHRRQEQEKYYRLNGAIYISKVDVLRQIQSFYGEKSYAYIMGRNESIDIDTEQDLELAEFLINKKQNGGIGNEIL